MNGITAGLGWVVPDIHTAVKFLANALGIAGFPNRNIAARTPSYARVMKID